MTNKAPSSVVGMWVTADGYIRQQLIAGGRYDEARGNKMSAYQGRYEVDGTRIRYWDDTGFEADGEFIDDVLHHVGMKFYRRDVPELMARSDRLPEPDSNFSMR